MYQIGTKLIVHHKVATLQGGDYDIATGKKCKKEKGTTMYFNPAMKNLAGKIVTVTECSHPNPKVFYILTTNNCRWALIPDWIQTITFKEL